MKYPVVEKVLALVDNVSPGDIITLPNEKHEYLVIFCKQGGCYLTPVDGDTLKPLVNAWGESSVRYENTHNLNIVDHVELEKVQKKGETWYLTGNEKIDINKMPHLDSRWKLFIQYAPKELQEQYAANEDKNFHSENGKLVNDFVATL